MTEHLRCRHLAVYRLRLGDCDCLTFVEHAEPVLFLDTDVADTELGLLPLVDVGLLVNDEGAEVARVEHHDVRRLARGVENINGYEWLFSGSESAING
jgi:hypothetical protein